MNLRWKMTLCIFIREMNDKKGLVMNMNVREILEKITKEHASDIFVVAGRPLTYKVNGKMHTYQEERMKPDMCRDFVTAIYELADHRDISQFETTGDDDFSFAIVGVSALINSVALTPPSSESSHSLCHSQVN